MSSSDQLEPPAPEPEPPAPEPEPPMNFGEQIAERSGSPLRTTGQGDPIGENADD